MSNLPPSDGPRDGDPMPEKPASSASQPKDTLDLSQSALNQSKMSVPDSKHPDSTHIELRASDVDSSYKPPGVHRVSPRPRLGAPLILFVATCLSTFWVGAADWRPLEHMQTTAQIQQTIMGNWQQGLTYMGAVLAILLTHEMGHFLMTVRHGIAASYPLCIPVPINPIGTMGAVIGMDGLKANRKEIFDIGLAGPLAGLAVAFPILWWGVQDLDLRGMPRPNEFQLYNPVIVRWMIEWAHPEWALKSSWVGVSQVNAFFMAGWVGMLVTGLNMLPVSQLDGGHTIHGLFGRDSHRIARAFTIVAIIYVVLYIDQASMWTLMLVLVILMGIHHPPTSDDNIELDNTRWIIGVASLSIPVLCFPLLGIKT